ncbi:MAG: DEAD/DEAH box helicase [Rhodopirellula sp.]|nr:DEAD/DEAH box helicase [Rhodopirellula sp.]
MSLIKVMEPRFRGDIRFRGAAYVQSERVEITHVTDDRLYGVVHDGDEFQTQLSRDDTQLVPFCTCAKPGQQEIHCKHVWATILIAQDQGYINGGVRVGHFPPFVAIEDDLDVDLNSELFDDISIGDAFAPTQQKTRASRQIEVPLSDWERRLKTIRDELDEGELASATSREREILYQLDIAASREHGQIIVDVAQRQRRASGQWGKLKPLKLKPGKLDDVEREEDRDILALMSGGVVDRSNWFGQQSEFQTAVYRYRLPSELGENVLPMLCQTGRFVVMDPKGDDTTMKITWDDGPAWRLSMGVVQATETILLEDGTETTSMGTDADSDADSEDDSSDEPRTYWTLEGRLSREDEAGTNCDVRDVTLIVPGGFVVRGRSIAHLEDFGAYEWIRLLRSKDVIRVPDGEESDFVDELLDMPAMPELELPEKLRLEEVTSVPRPKLVVAAPRGRWKYEKLRAEVHFDYDGTDVRGSSRRAVIVQRELGRCLVRNRHAEQELWKKLDAFGFRRLLDRRRGAHDVEISTRELGPAVRQLIDEKWQVQADGRDVRQAGPIQFRVNTSTDWFELRADVDFAGLNVSLPELLAALSRGETTIQLDDGSMGILPEEWLAQYGLLTGLGTPDGENLRFSNTQAGLLDALLSGQESVDYDAKFLEIRDRMRKFDGVNEAVAPPTFHGELRGYQKEGLGWLQYLQAFGFGGCLADDMGLGKTVQLLALLQERKDQQMEPKYPTLIVVPKSLLFNWIEEGHRFTPDLKMIEYIGIERAQLRDEFHKVDVVLTTYGTLRRDIYQLKDIPFDYIVLDEAQTIKNSASQVAKASRLLNARYRVALSGTPIENHLGDLWSIFEFLNPGMLGRSSLFRIYAADATDAESRELLRKGLDPFILRRTKQQVANDLPEKLEQTIYCEMGREQQKLYDEMRAHYRESLIGLVKDQGLAKSQMHVLEALLRLRQAACHPGLLDEERIDGASAKMDVLLSHVEELIGEGHKALVFSQFTSLLSIVRKRFDEKGITYEYLDGQTRNRKEHVDRFQNDPECPVFLISLKAGGLGLNLTAAEYVFLLDPWWNPAVEAQAIDRAHRVGQTKQVFAYRLICRGTVEEKIASLQQQKKELADAILQENNSVMKKMTVEDLDMLLS